MSKPKDLAEATQAFRHEPARIFTAYRTQAAKDSLSGSHGPNTRYNTLLAEWEALAENNLVVATSRSLYGNKNTISILIAAITLAKQNNILMEELKCMCLDRTKPLVIIKKGENE